MACVFVAACGGSTPPLETAEPGVVFNYPADAQLDVPLGTRIVVEFSDPIDAHALASCGGQGANPTGAFCIVGPSGAVDVLPAATDDGNGVVVASAPLEAGATYQVFVTSAVSPPARNLPASGPLFSFTTRSERPRAAPPALVAINGAPPASPESFRPMFESSTIRLVFSEPLDSRSVQLAPGSIQLVDKAADRVVPATLVASGIHVSIDPIDDLTAGTKYEVQLGNLLVDLGGQPLAPIAIPITPHDTRGGNAPIPEVLRTRQTGDPGAATSRAGAATNVIAMDKPLIGSDTSQLQPAVLAAELGDPKALGGPLAFTLRRGQRLHATGLDVKLGGSIPVGLSTGDIEIELLTDASGRIYRNPHQPDDQRPENERAPLYTDLSMDVAVYAVDPTGNAVLAQTVLGLQASGVVLATDGVLDIQTVTSMDLGLLGVTTAPTNLVLELVTDPTAEVPTDTTAPALVASLPNGGELPVDDGVELIFSEPVDLDRVRAGGARLETSGGAPVASVIESHGSAIVIRPIAPLPYSASFRVVLADVADVAGNPLPATGPIDFSTPKLAGTGVPITAVAVNPGVPCALSNGRCTGGSSGDDIYRPFSLAADEPLSITFSAPVAPGTVTHATGCNPGNSASVRIEQVDAGGGCIAAVPGTLTHHDRTITFIPDVPWTPGTKYALTVVTGGNSGCDTGELCGVAGGAASFDPLNGASGGDGGGPSLSLAFTATAATDATFVFASTSPFTDINGSGTIDGVESTRDENRVALRITGTHGIISSASFNATDCIPSTPEREACIYLNGAMPVQLQPVSASCPLPDGSNAPSCVPVTISPQVMYGTSVHLDATAIITIGSDTGTTVIRIREPASGPVTGYIVDQGGTPTMVLALDLYMDAPDMSIPLASHDLHSKPLSVALSGPVSFLPDGRIAIAVANVDDVPISVTVDAGIVGSGRVDMIVPRGEMKLQLVSQPIRGGAR